MTDDEYRNLVQQLNVKQKEFFYHVLNWMKTKTDPLYHFLSGGAGVGKSVLLKALNQALVKHFSHKAGENPDNVHVLICAPTGKAAFNVGGCTVHSAFHIPTDQGFHFKPLDMQQLSNLQSKFKCLKILFIDEISMVGKNMFNSINLRLQEILGCTKPFGGISVISFGDLYQLKPVFDQWIFASNNSSTESIASLGTNLWTDHFLLYELDQIMRQKDDLRFAQMLNRIREGNHVEEDMATLKMKMINEENDRTRNMPHLFTHRCDVENYNKNVFQHLCDSKKTVVEAIDSISGDLPCSLHKKVLLKIPTDATKTKGLNKYLCIGEGLPAEICVNIDVSDGLANGTPCIITKLDFRVPGSSRCSIVWVKICSEDIGKKCRTQYRHLFSSAVSSSWTPILETTRKFNINYYKSFHVTRRQFPLNLAAAKTVHKAQGCTLESAVLGLGKKKIDHLYYVALSRVKHLSSVFLLNFDPNCIKVSDAVVEEMNRLRTFSQVHISIPLLYNTSENVFKIIFHNCRSLKKHIADVRADSNMLAANIIAFGETCLKNTDQSYIVNLEGFHLSRNDDSCCFGRAYHGLAVYTKGVLNSFVGANIFDVEFTHGYILHLDLLIHVCFLYCSPKIASVKLYKKFFAHLDTVYNLKNPHIVMGDFNLDFYQAQVLPSFLYSKYSLSQLISIATTNYDSILDHVYTNLDKKLIYMSGVLESYFSDHKPVFIGLSSN